MVSLAFCQGSALFVERSDVFYDTEVIGEEIEQACEPRMGRGEGRGEGVLDCCDDKAGWMSALLSWDESYEEG